MPISNQNTLRFIYIEREWVRNEKLKETLMLRNAKCNLWSLKSKILKELRNSWSEKKTIIYFWYYYSFFILSIWNQNQTFSSWSSSNVIITFVTTFTSLSYNMTCNFSRYPFVSTTVSLRWCNWQNSVKIIEEKKEKKLSKKSGYPIEDHRTIMVKNEMKKWKNKGRVTHIYSHKK